MTKVELDNYAGNRMPVPEYVTIIFTLPNGDEIRCRLREDGGDTYLDVYGSGDRALIITPWASNRIRVRCKRENHD